MVALNWWMKPITRTTVIELNVRGKTFNEKLNDFIVRLFIRHENPKIELPPGLDDTPTTSEGTTVDEDMYVSDDIPLKGTRKSLKEPKQKKYCDDEV